MHDRVAIPNRFAECFRSLFLGFGGKNTLPGICYGNRVDVFIVHNNFNELRFTPKYFLKNTQFSYFHHYKFVTTGHHMTGFISSDLLITYFTNSVFS